MTKPYQSADAYALARQRLPETRPAMTHKFKVGNTKGYLTVGLNNSGEPMELFLKMHGSEFSGWTNSIGILTSLALQSGIPLFVIVKKMEFQTFEPSGPTNHPRIHMAKSIVDYVFRWLGHEFIEGYGEEEK